MIEVKSGPCSMLWPLCRSVEPSPGGWSTFNGPTIDRALVGEVGACKARRCATRGPRFSSVPRLRCGSRRYTSVPRRVPWWPLCAGLGVWLPSPSPSVSQISVTLKCVSINRQLPGGMPVLGIWGSPCLAPPRGESERGGRAQCPLSSVLADPCVAASDLMGLG
jgi:hypothetical protein